MKRKIKSMLLATLFGFGLNAVHAESVEPEQAKRAVSKWLTSGRPLEKNLGKSVKDVRTVSTDDGTKFYVVKLEGGGFVVTSSDTQIEPIICFSPSDDLIEDKNNPLWAMLTNDLPGRTKALKERKKAKSQNGTINEMSEEELRWSELLSDGRKKASTVLPYRDFSDVRVMPLVKSKWGQQGNSINGGTKCYNYYTPNDYSGCVATAMAQIMRYHKYPTSAVEPQTFTCKLRYESRDLTMMGGVYDWDKMPLIPESDPNVAWYAGGATEEQRQEIGKLMYDCGVAMRMNYNWYISTSYGTLAFDPLVNVFGYASAHGYSNGKWELSAYNTQNMILTNLDAGYPVLLGIGKTGTYNSTGHAVVGDGYGYDGNSNIYLHINMGYDGSQDAWYNLPDIAEYDAITDVVYNIMPRKTGEIISGRVLDKNGVAVKNAEVEIANTDRSFVSTARTSEKGIYSFVVPSSAQYSVTATISDVSETISASVSTSSDYSYIDFSGGYISGSANCGNSWGNDISISELELEVPNAIEITNTTLPAGEEGVAYEAQLPLTGGSAPLHFFGPKDIYKETFAESNSFDANRGDAMPMKEHFLDQWGEPNGYEMIDIPFDFPFGGQIHSSLEVNIRGEVKFENGSINVLNNWDYFDYFRIESSAESLTLQWDNQRSVTIYPDGKIRVAYGTIKEYANLYTSVTIGDWSAEFDKKASATDYSGANDLVIVPADIPIGLSLDENTGKLTGKPQLAGSYEFEVTVADEQGNKLVETMTMTVAASTNHKPVITGYGPEPTEGIVYAEINSTTEFHVNAKDEETPSALTYSWYLDGKLVGSGSTYNYVGACKNSDFSDRDHKLVCKVSDTSWEERVSKTWQIKLITTYYVDANANRSYDSSPQGTADDPFTDIPYDEIVQEGDVIYVRPGHYRSIDAYETKKLKIISTDGPGSTFANMFFVTSNVSSPDDASIIIDGFTLERPDWNGNNNIEGAILSNCIIDKNSSVEIKNSKLINCVIANIDELSLDNNRLYNCTVVNNSGSLDKKSKAYNSIIWNNSTTAETEETQTYNCIVDTDPMLWDTENGMFFLRPGSPCLNAGDNDYIYTGSTKDIVGHDRIQGDHVDIGAYEGIGLTSIKNINADGNNVITLETQKIDGEDVLCATQSVSLLNGADNYYRSPVDFYVPELTYTRRFPDNDFNAIYLPFSMSYSDWAEYGDMYRLDNIFTNDADDDGNADSWALRVLKLKSNAKTEPNTPYVFKPKQAGEVTFSVQNAKLTKSAELSIDCANTEYKFVFKGTTEKTKINGYSYFFISNNSMLQYSYDDVSLRALRWYMGIYSKETGYSVSPSDFAPTTNEESKKIHIFSDSDYATDIHLLDAPSDASAPSVYDLSGRKLNSVTKSGMYIVNGNKVFINK